MCETEIRHTCPPSSNRHPTRPTTWKPSRHAPDGGAGVGAAVHDDAGTLTVELTFSVALVSLASRTHQLSGDLHQFLSPQQQANFENAALNLYAKAKAELLA